MKSKGAVGPDDIPPSFLKSFGLLAVQELLSIFNSSFCLAHSPRIWRVAIIIPLLKAEKSPSKVPSSSPKEFLLIVFTTSQRRKCCSADSKLGSVKFGATTIRSLIVQAIKDGCQCNAPHWHCWTSAKPAIQFGEKSFCLIFTFIHLVAAFFSQRPQSTCSAL